MTIANLLKPKKQKVVLSKDMWGTPDYLYAGLDAEFHFVLDAAASEGNAKCYDYITEEEDAFQTEWKSADVNLCFGNVFLNPPYSQSAGGLINWIERAYEQSQKHKVSVVCVVPGDTSTKYRKFAMRYGSEIRDLDHRVKFVGATGSPPWPTAIYVFRPVKNRLIGGANITIWDYKNG